MYIYTYKHSVYQNDVCVHECIYIYTCISLPIKITSPTNLQKLGPLFILKFGIVWLCSVVPQSMVGIIARRESVVLLK